MMNRIASPRRLIAVFCQLAQLTLIAGCMGVMLSGCVVHDRREREQRLPRAQDRGLKRNLTPRAERYAWEIWPTERDLEGGSLKNSMILRGDTLLDHGKRREALVEYQRVKPEVLAGDEKDALALRIASTQLSLRQAKPALSTISAYFKTEGKSVADSDAYYSLVLGFGYAVIGDIDQSFAWLSRAKRVGARSAAVGNSAYFGLYRSAQSLESDRIETLSESWRADSFVSSILGKEQRRRSFGGEQVAIGTQKEGLYEQVQIALSQDRANLAEEKPGAFQPSKDQVPAIENATPVGVILPLSGKFAALGASVKNGIDLALSASGQPVLNVIYRDDGGNANQSALMAQEISSAHAAFILGPLLSEGAEAVAAVTSEASAPVISFSKKEVFSGGRGAFRLGATASSQVKSLFNAIETKLGLKKLAVVYPDDESGHEFARLFRESAQQRSLTLVFEAPYRRSEPDALISIAAQLEQVHPDGIFFPDNIIEATRFFTALKPAVRESLVPLGPASWDNEAQLNRSKNVLEGAVFVSPFFARSRKEIIVRFIEAYQARYKSTPDFLAAQGFDSATLALAALRKQTTEGVAFSQALAAIERYEGLTGTIQVQMSGEIERNFEVVALTQGVLGEIQERKPEMYIGRGNVVQNRVLE